MSIASEARTESLAAVTPEPAGRLAVVGGGVALLCLVAVLMEATVDLLPDDPIVWVRRTAQAALPGYDAALGLLAVVVVAVAASAAARQVASDISTGFCRGALDGSADVCAPGTAIRAIGTFSNPNLLAAFLVLLLPVAAAGSMALADRASRLLGTTVVVLGYAAVLMTGSRGGVIAAVAGAAAFVMVELGGRDGSPGARRDTCDHDLRRGARRTRGPRRLGHGHRRRAGLAGFAVMSLADHPANAIRVSLALWVVLALVVAGTRGPGLGAPVTAPTAVIAALGGRRRRQPATAVRSRSGSR